MHHPRISRKRKARHNSFKPHRPKTKRWASPPFSFTRVAPDTSISDPDLALESSLARRVEQVRKDNRSIDEAAQEIVQDIRLLNETIATARVSGFNLNISGFNLLDV